MKHWKCNVPGCDFETSNPHSKAGHIGGHAKRGELPKKSKLPAPIKPPLLPTLPTPVDVADALLKRVVTILTNNEKLQEEVTELKGYRTRVGELEGELKKANEDKDRILKLHNEQAKRGVLTDSKTLLKLAKL